jgi:hypothetical protein
MTELTKYICDMCGAEQELNTSPQRMETNYVRFIGMIANLDRDLSIQALCPRCAGEVGQFIKEYRKILPTNLDKTENRVSTMR